MSDTFDKINGRRFVWRDPQGLLHAGERLGPQSRTLRTKCDRPGGIPSACAWLQRLDDQIDCPDCLAAILPPPETVNEGEQPS